jgi:hypothetical protein
MPMKGSNIACTMILCIALAVSGCSTESRQGATQGATAGAAVGAVGGVVSALVFGGDVVEGAARGAVWGGSTGAASGAIAGAQVADQKKAADQQKVAAELEKVRREVGDDAFLGLEALVDCKLPVALAYAETAQGSSNKNYSLAGLWLELLTLSEQGKGDSAQARLPELVAKDPQLKTTEAAGTLLGQANKQVGDIREYYGLGRSCT